MIWSYKIEKAINGFIISDLSDEPEQPYVTAEADVVAEDIAELKGVDELTSGQQQKLSELQAMVDALRYLAEQFGFYHNKYDKTKIRIGIEVRKE
jgi:uncharacterized protein HemX